MNILYVSAKKGWGGVLTWVYRTAIGLEARGHKAWIISHPASPFTRVAPEGAKIIPMRLGMDFSPAAILYLVAFIKRRRVDVVVTNIQKEVLAGGLAARICGIPNVRMLGNEYDLNDRIRWRQQALVDHTLVPSDATLRAAASKLAWLDPTKFSTIYAGCDPVTYPEREIAELRGSWGIPAASLVFGITARLAEVKRIDGLIAAFEPVARSHREAYLVITGEGPERQRLGTLAREFGLADRVVFAGFTSEPLKTAAAYDVAVLNSSVEGFPVVIVEYMAAGRPVVATDVGGIGEIVRDGENGVLLPAGDEAGLTRSLLALAGDAATRQRLGENAVRTIRAGFSEAIMVERTERVFEMVTGAGGKRGSDIECSLI